jgi:hypothetical protein
VALHRAAYLLYAERRRIAGGGVLVVGPSPVFMSYIERVLPSLGESEATLRSIGEVVDGVVAARSDPFDAAIVKGSLRMRRVLGRAARDAVPGAPEELRLYAGGRQLWLGPTELASVRDGVLRRGLRRNRARSDAVRALLDLLWRKASSPGGSRSRNDFDDDVRDRDAFVEFVDEWWPVLTPAQVLGWLGSRPRLERAARGILRPAEVEALARTWAGAGGDRELSVEDVALVDELHALLGEPPRPRVRPQDDAFDYDGVHELTTVADREYAARAPMPSAEQYDGYAHVLVDEAQDLSPMQWRMLGRRGRHASWTIVGDPAQSSWPDAGEATTARDAALGRRARRTFQLSTNYRNGREIFDLAASVIRQAIPDLELPRAVRETGHPPEHVVVDRDALADAVRRSVADLLGAVDGTVGVIVPAALLSDADGWLARVDDRTQESHVDGDGSGRIVVTTGLASKGLEFDAVAVVEPEEIAAESPVGIRTLYVALTRATQRLVTVGADGNYGEMVRNPVVPAPGY